MKFLLKGETQQVGVAFYQPCGVGCDEVVFSLRDIQLMAKAGPQATYDWLTEVVQCRFDPNSVEHRRRVEPDFDQPWLSKEAADKYPPFGQIGGPWSLVT